MLASWFTAIVTTLAVSELLAHDAWVSLIVAVVS